MRAWTAWMPVLLLAGLVIGCNEQKTEPPVTQAPAQAEPLTEFPESQVPPAEPPAEEIGPMPRTTAPAVAPPVDTTAELAAKNPSGAPQPKPKESYAPASTKASRAYVVRSGDTLQKISKKYYGTTKKWRGLYNVNRQALGSDPDHLVVGTKLTIP